MRWNAQCWELCGVGGFPPVAQGGAIPRSTFEAGISKSAALNVSDDGSDEQEGGREEMGWFACTLC